MIVVVALRSAGIGVREIVSISLPRTSTFVGSDNDAPLPSNTLTLLNSVTGPLACWACAAPVEVINAQTAVADTKRRKFTETIQQPPHLRVHTRRHLKGTTSIPAFFNACRISRPISTAPGVSP